MDKYKLKWTRLQNAIFRLLCINAGNSLSQREIAKLLKVSPTAVGKSLKQLKKEDILKIANYHGKANISSVELNRDNKKAIEMKRVENLKMIYESELSDFLFEGFPGCTIILFGSYSKGEDIISSDIDIAIIGTKGKTINIEKFDKFLGKEVIINFYDSFKNIHNNLKENLYNGIVLVGGVEL